MTTEQALKAPFPYFGGKSRVLCAVVTCVIRGEWLAPNNAALGIRVLR